MEDEDRYGHYLFYLKVVSFLMSDSCASSVLEKQGLSTHPIPFPWSKGACGVAGAQGSRILQPTSEEEQLPSLQSLPGPKPQTCATSGMKPVSPPTRKRKENSDTGQLVHWSPLFQLSVLSYFPTFFFFFD